MVKKNKKSLNTKEFEFELSFFWLRLKIKIVRGQAPSFWYHYTKNIMKIKVDVSWEKPTKKEILDSIYMIGVIGLIVYLIRR